MGARRQWGAAPRGDRGQLRLCAPVPAGDTFAARAQLIDAAALTQHLAASTSYIY